MKKLRVLVVDDCRATTLLVRNYLNRCGVESSALNDSRDAVAWVQRQRPDIVLLDIQMPHLDGYEVARRIRREANQDCLIVAISGKRGDDYNRRCDEAGIEGRLTKPVALADLLEVLNRHCATAY